MSTTTLLYLVYHAVVVVVVVTVVVTPLSKEKKENVKRKSVKKSKILNEFIYLLTTAVTWYSFCTRGIVRTWRCLATSFCTFVVFIVWFISALVLWLIVS